MKHKHAVLLRNQRVIHSVHCMSHRWFPSHNRWRTPTLIQWMSNHIVRFLTYRYFRICWNVSSHDYYSTTCRRQSAVKVTELQSSPFDGDGSPDSSGRRRVCSAQRYPCVAVVAEPVLCLTLGRPRDRSSIVSGYRMILAVYCAHVVCIIVLEFVGSGTTRPTLTAGRFHGRVPWLFCVPQRPVHGAHRFTFYTADLLELIETHGLQPHRYADYMHPYIEWLWDRSTDRRSDWCCELGVV